MSRVTHLSEDVIDVIRNVSREESSRVFAERRWRKRPRYQGGSSAGGWQVDYFEFGGGGQQIDKGNTGTLNWTAPYPNPGLITPFGPGLLAATVPYVGMVRMWLRYEAFYSASTPTFIEWSVGGGFQNDYTDFTWSADDSWEHIPTGTGLVTNSRGFTQPIKIAATGGSGDLNLQVTYDDGFSGEIFIEAGWCAFHGKAI